LDSAFSSKKKMKKSLTKLLKKRLTRFMPMKTLKNCSNNSHKSQLRKLPRKIMLRKKKSRNLTQL
jgi:hypothetical protein